jgi:hypothetical protein
VLGDCADCSSQKTSFAGQPYILSGEHVGVIAIGGLFRRLERRLVELGHKGLSANTDAGSSGGARSKAGKEVFSRGILLGDIGTQ